MNEIIKSNDRIVAISSLGAEIQSLSSVHSGEEFMWQGNPSIWAGRAPILFPVVGALKGNQMLAKGSQYSMKKHGFARTSEFELVEKADDLVKYQLKSSKKTLLIFPWHFKLSVVFCLTGNLLRILYTVKNDDSDIMYFNIGSHPAFNIPLGTRGFDDYSIRFDTAETADLHRVVDDLIPRESSPYLQKQKEISLTPDIFNEDALVFLNISSTKVSLVHKEKGERIEVTTGGAPHLGLWAKPAAPYVCIEPWFGHADFSDAGGAIDRKESIQMLKPGETFKAELSIRTLDTL